MQTCTWAPTTFQGTQVVNKTKPGQQMPGEDVLMNLTTRLVREYEALGIDNLLVAQRWWGTGQEIEASSLDCLAMTALFAGATEKIQLITAIHPGFMNPAAVAKWGATLDLLTQGRWSINVTTGWNLQEFDMYGVEPLAHDQRYARACEFIQVLRGAWDNPTFDHAGKFYQQQQLQLEPRPSHPLRVYQGGQSDDAIAMAAQHSDWMFINGGSPEKVAGIIERARAACAVTQRDIKFAMYAAPLCRASDAAAWQEIDARLTRVDQSLVSKRQQRVSGAEGMWADQGDPLSVLDTNEGYVPRLIGSPDTVMARIETFKSLGIDMLHLDVSDPLFREAVLPQIASI
jgi:dimethylsulfone monooxygenase